MVPHSKRFVFKSLQQPYALEISILLNIFFFRKEGSSRRETEFVYFQLFAKLPIRSLSVSIPVLRKSFSFPCLTQGELEKYHNAVLHILFAPLLVGILMLEETF